MPRNFNALFRHRIIDRVLSSFDIKVTWENLREAIETESIEAGIQTINPSRRTILKDIAEMRSGIFGYSAPIDYNKSRGYHYSNPQFSIYNIPLSKVQIRNIKELIISLKSIVNIEALQTVYQDVLMLEQKLNIQDNIVMKPIIHFDKQDDYLGAVWMNKAYQSIKNEKSLSILYEPFLADKMRMYLSPLLLKSYNKRWYLIAYDHDTLKIINLPLDRIIDIVDSLNPYQSPIDFDYDIYIKDVYGVTKDENQEPILLTFRTNPLLTEYLRTKPIHRSQMIKSESSGKSIITLLLIPNYEIKHLLRGYGSQLEMIHPKEFLDF